MFHDWEAAVPFSGRRFHAPFLLLSMHRYGPRELVNSSGRRPGGLRPADRPKIGTMRSPLFFPLPQSVERQIDHGSRVKREHLRNDKPPNDGNTERFA